VGGFAIGARAMLAGSRLSVFPSRWEAREFALYAEAQGITVVSLVPAQVYDLVSAQLHCPVSLKTVVVGGGALSDALATRALALGWQVRRTYGMTEAASMIAAQRSSEDAMMEVLPHWQVRVDEGDALLIKGPSLARGYAIRAADGRWCWEVIEPMAGLRTRDHVSLSAHAGRHCLAFIGRESSFVKILGELVNVVALQQRLDDALLQSGLHVSAVLVPLPDQRRETRLVLAVPPGMAAEERARLLTVYHASCQPYEHVSEIVEVEVIPRSGLGKVETGRLREALMRRAGEAP
jgi:O-succinylbenzoic acid--CoA ligase